MSKFDLEKIIDTKFIEDGLRFECQGSGRCCSSRGEYGYVYLTLKDRRRMAKELGLATGTFTKKYCEKSDGWYHLKETAGTTDCMFLKDKRCEVYKGRPTQCRTWPFWPEVMQAKAWNKEVIGYCPGAGKGRKHSADEIKKVVLEQLESEREL